MELRNFGKKAELDLKLSSALARGYQAVRRRSDSYLSGQGLSLAQFNVLEVLSIHGVSPVGHLVQQTDITPGNMTVIIENLLKQGLITRERDNSDKRVWLVSLSPRGLEKLNRVYPMHILNLQSLFSRLDEREKSALIDLCDRLADYTMTREE